ESALLRSSGWLHSPTATGHQGPAARLRRSCQRETASTRLLLVQERCYSTRRETHSGHIALLSSSPRTAPWSPSIRPANTFQYLSLYMHVHSIKGDKISEVYFCESERTTNRSKKDETIVTVL
ncbi:hypothetical protein T265_10820, partial [Opisthorchis viverrini]